MRSRDRESDGNTCACNIYVREKNVTASSNEGNASFSLSTLSLTHARILSLSSTHNRRNTHSITEFIQDFIEHEWRAYSFAFSDTRSGGHTHPPTHFHSLPYTHSSIWEPKMEIGIAYFVCTAFNISQNSYWNEPGDPTYTISAKGVAMCVKVKSMSA